MLEFALVIPCVLITLELLSFDADCDRAGSEVSLTLVGCTDACGCFLATFGECFRRNQACSYRDDVDLLCCDCVDIGEFVAQATDFRLSGECTASHRSADPLRRLRAGDSSRASFSSRRRNRAGIPRPLLKLISRRKISGHALRLVLRNLRLFCHNSVARGVEFLRKKDNSCALCSAASLAFFVGDQRFLELPMCFACRNAPQEEILVQTSRSIQFAALSDFCLLPSLVLGMDESHSISDARSAPDSHAVPGDHLSLWVRWVTAKLFEGRLRIAKVSLGSACSLASW
jgi:hypothetical protein